MKRLSSTSKVFLTVSIILFLPATFSNTLAGPNNVDFRDYSYFADDWLRCNDPCDPNCEEVSPDPGPNCNSSFNVINIDLNGSPADSCYSGTAAFAQEYDTDCVIGEWNGYYQGEGELMDSPRSDNIGVPFMAGTYARTVFIVDPCTHGYVSGEPNLLGDGFVKSGGGEDPALFMYGNWAYGGIFDVYVLASTPGSFTIRDGKGTIQTAGLTGDSNESNWVEGLNYVKFEDVWIGGTNTRDANGIRADYLDNGEYLTDPNCAVLKYSNQINGIQLASVKRKVRAAGPPSPADPCVCYWDDDYHIKKKIEYGQWTVNTPIAVINSPLPSTRKLFFCADYDAAYETNARAMEPDYDGPDAGWALVPDGSPEPLEGYVDEDWANEGHVAYVDTGEWFEYDIIATPETRGQYRIRALVNCWYGAADIGIYMDDSSELDVLEHDKYDDMTPPIEDPNALVWTYGYGYINIFSGLHRLRCKQNGAYYTIFGFEISALQPIEPLTIIPIEDCQDVLNYGLGMASDLNYDCYVNIEDLALFVDTWLVPEP